MLPAAIAHHLPNQVSLTLVERLLEGKNVSVRIASPRKTKRGDYRHPLGSKPHLISVNGNLPPYSFLVTLVHEIAHLYVWERFGKKAKPHGIEWKRTFQGIMQPFLEEEIFPEHIKTPLARYLRNPAASTSGDMELYKALEYAHKKKVDTYLVEDVPDGDRFTLNDGRTFTKLYKLRKTFLCEEVSTGRKYRVSPLMEALRHKNGKMTD